ncbi:MAG: DUF2341 domain-containing protein, partial [Candidatus Aenigmarchaeota archaeon]|nr:DUF2341 domain-containing protein [Candidatus Aenigmarchaeota archaeon]
WSVYSLDGGSNRTGCSGCTSFSTTIAKKGWWNSTFEKKKEIQINNTDLEVANYSLLLNVSYVSDMNNDFSDIRFINGSEDTELSYWIESKVDSSYADVWVKIAYVLTNTTNTTIYMYYDNSSAVSSESDSSQTFLYYNDFSTSDGLTETDPNSCMVVNTTSKRVEFTNCHGAVLRTTSLVDLSDAIEMEWVFELTSATEDGSMSQGITTDSNSIGAGTAFYDTYKKDAGVASFLMRATAGLSEYSGEAFATTYWVTKINYGNTTQTGELFTDRTRTTSADKQTNNLAPNVVNSYLYMAFSVTNAERTHNGWTTNYTIKKYLDVTPTYSFGSEETSSLSDGFYNVTVYANDTVGNMNSSIRYFTVDTTKPTYSNNSTNSTEVGEYILHSLKWTDNINLSGYIFSFDNGTGTFSNDSWVAFSANPDWSNVSKYVNSTVGSNIQWRVYANDTAGNMNTSLTYSFLTTSAGDSTSPIITVQSPTNKSYNTTTVWFNTTLNEEGSWCGYSLDGAANVTMTNSSGNWNAQNNSMTEGQHEVTFSCNDTTGNMNTSGATIVFTVDLTKPTYSLNSTNSTYAGYNILH